MTVAPAAQGYDIDIDGQASSVDLLDAIASGTGATIKGQPKDATLASNHLRGTTFERALRKLLPGAAFTVRYADDGKPTEIIFLTADTAGDGGDSPAPEADAPATGEDNQDSASPDPNADAGSSDGSDSSSDSGSEDSQPAQ